MQRVQYSGAGEITLVGDAFGDAGAPPVILLHGGGQTRHAWGRAGRALAAAGFRAIALDARGHGDSSWAGDGNYHLDGFVGDLRAVAAAHEAPPAVVGASLGGLTALLCAGERGANDPALSAVVLVDVAHRMDPSGVDRIISFMEAKLKDGFASVDEAADFVAAYLPHRERPDDTSGLAKNLRRGDDGRYRWHWDPAFLRQDHDLDPGVMKKRLADATRALDVPTLLVRGGLSDVLPEDAAREFRTLAPHAEYADVAAAAHMVAGDDNDAFSDAVVTFLRRVMAPDLAS